MKDVSLLVDLFFGIVAKRIGSDVVVDIRLRDFSNDVIAVVEQLHGSPDACLIMTLCISLHCPSFGCSLGEQEFNLGRSDENTGTVRLFECQGKEGTCHTGRKVALVVTLVRIVVYKLLESRNL